MSEELKPFQRVLVRDHDTQHWRASFFSNEVRCDVTRIYHTVSGVYRQCIPYTDETAHLLGTTDSPAPPEPEFKWGDKVQVSDGNDMWCNAIFLTRMSGENVYPYLVIRGGESEPIEYKFCRHADW